MNLWIITTDAEDGAMTVKKMAGSEKEAREYVAALPNADTCTGTSALVELATDKPGVIALFNGDYEIKNTLKTFSIVNGKWKQQK